ncbi:2',3'-cyclic-nucleotide 2'-phosphodiesterase (5'-nucleotidase family) [Ulvibacter sp. MAR_2010_11]|uniref:bifunctional metallophosphatase/5'-nucleotidase n=1 Tax=Ulvibacter sp. MAR_2010_11 TaxID=1250229 RepID=UPI000C2BEFCF|nr:bifunctional metallophosphatase/5'-nucleotidase [Ulvibacter sp. MAR_2010_11]PKA82073.1 2',3'-cyclic-nucleotide 2'-phosphodiesterase (5'-nucleotidase family) [Ulvibacter sp. MAR_2010_11]
MKQHLLLTFLIGLLLIGCKPKQKVTQSKKDDGFITVKLIQVNDVYEVAPLNNGKYGGMARVAHVRDSIAKVNPNTLLFMAGDFLNPSLIGTLKYEGERIAGKQMIEVMNAMNFDLVTFGNHEFDVGEEALQKRLNESNFPWTSANVRHVTEDGTIPFSLQKDIGNVPVKDTYSLALTDADGTQLNLGFFSVTIDSNPQDFVYYGDVFSEAGRAYGVLKSKSDVVIGLTHLTLAQDKQLSKQLPELKFIMGGHEHNNMLVPTETATIVKADANAKTIYIHTLTYNTSTKELKIDSQLFPIDDRIASKPEVKAIVDRWNAILDNNIKQVISDPNEVIYYANPPLDGTDSANRGVQTNLGDILTHAMALSFNENVDAALVNGGSIRLDDVLEGDVTSLDIFRVLPFGGSVVKADVTGDLLIRVLDYGKARGGTGAYLQRYNFREGTRGRWMIGGVPIQQEETYTVAFSDFLLKGYDIPFLTPENEGVLKVYEPLKTEPAYDIRKAVILYLKSLKK